MTILKKELARAIAFASTVHAEHLDRGGQPYILHPIRIMSRIMHKYPDRDEMAIVAICHDTIEDGWEDNLTLGFEIFSQKVTNDDEVLEALILLTHKKGVEYFDYIKGLQYNFIARNVKIEDLTDNSDITRLKGLREKDFERLKKYHKSYCFLTGQTDKLLDL